MLSYDHFSSKIKARGITALLWLYSCICVLTSAESRKNQFNAVASIAVCSATVILLFSVGS